MAIERCTQLEGYEVVRVASGSPRYLSVCSRRYGGRSFWFVLLDSLYKV